MIILLIFCDSGGFQRQNLYFWSRKQLYSILSLQKTAKITSLIFIKENMMKKVSTCCYRPRDLLKHSVRRHGYNGYIRVWADTCCCETRIPTSWRISHHFHMPQCSWKALREENATPPTKYMEIRKMSKKFQN